MTIDQKANYMKNKNEMVDRAALAALSSTSTDYQKDRAQSISDLLRIVTDDPDVIAAGWLHCAKVDLKDIESTYGNDVAALVVQASGPLRKATVEAKKIRLAEFYQSVKEDNFLGRGVDRKKLLKQFKDCKNEIYYQLKQLIYA